MGGGGGEEGDGVQGITHRNGLHNHPSFIIKISETSIRMAMHCP